MGKIIINGHMYGDHGEPTVVYVSERAIGDEDGRIITEDYLRASVMFDPNKIIEIEEQPNAGFHNSFYRGKDITSKITDGSIWTAISSGAYTDLFVGDYFTVNDHKYIIAGFNLFYNNGDTAFTDQHIVCLPCPNEYERLPDQYENKAMKSTDSTVGGCASVLSSLMSPINSVLTTDFGSHLCSHRELLSSAIEASVPNGPNPSLTGASSSWSWQSVQATLMTELEITGTTLMTSSGYDVGTGKTQLPLFMFDRKIYCYTSMWTRSVASSTEFVAIYNRANPFSEDASHRWIDGQAVRAGMYLVPRFCLKG